MAAGGLARPVRSHGPWSRNAGRSAPLRWRSTRSTSKPSIKSQMDCRRSSVCRNDDYRGSKRELVNVRFGSKADISQCNCHVRFTPESGHLQCNSPGPSKPEFVRVFQAMPQDVLLTDHARTL